MSCKKETGCTTTVTQKSINENVSLSLDGNILTLIIGNKIHTVELDDIGGGSGGGGYPTIILPILSNNQVVFTNVIPTGKVLLKVFLNGIKATAPQTNIAGDYSVVGNNITWLSSIPLETDDVFEIELGDMII
jgi:hypothetical protein